VKKRALAESFRKPHFDDNGDAKKKFNSYWEADKAIQRSRLEGRQSYYCPFTGAALEETLAPCV